MPEISCRQQSQRQRYSVGWSQCDVVYNLKRHRSIYGSEVGHTIEDPHPLVLQAHTVAPSDNPPSVQHHLGDFKFFGIVKRLRHRTLTPASLVQIQLPKPLRVLQTSKNLKLLNILLYFFPRGRKPPLLFFLFYLFISL